MKLLYITANSKEQQDSASRTVARRLVNAIIAEHHDIELVELDLYQCNIPLVKGSFYEGRNAIVNQEARAQLPKKDQADINRIEELCQQFIDCDLYVLAAPMWSLSFPAIVKQYIDCIIQSDKTIAFDNDMPHGLLDDKDRIFVYVQSSGGSYPFFLSSMMKGISYTKSIMKFLGISTFKQLLVEGTGNSLYEQQQAIDKATDKIPSVVNSLNIGQP